MSDDKKKLYDIIDSYRTAMLITTKREDGAIRARPMVVARADEDGTLWFLTSVEGNLDQEVEEHPDAAITMQDSSTFLSMTGKAKARRDDKSIEELWSKEYDLWFEKKDAVVIEFKGREAEYWKEGLKGLKYLFEAARAVIKDEHIRPDKVGDHAKVKLS